jgi:hypothetical protein
MGRMWCGAQFGDCTYTVKWLLWRRRSIEYTVICNYDDVKYFAPRQSDSGDACETGQ